MASTITTRDGVELYVKQWGIGRPVVMMHGWPLSSDTFDDLGLALADAGFRGIAYDRRGFGRRISPGAATTTTRSPTIWRRSSKRPARAMQRSSGSRWAVGKWPAT